MDENEKMILDVPDRKTIPCLKCKKGRFNYLAEYCQAYDKKPREVYYQSKDCPNFEPIIK